MLTVLFFKAENLSLKSPLRVFYMEKEIDKMIVRHHQRINDINRYYPDNDYFHD